MITGGNTRLFSNNNYTIAFYLIFLGAFIMIFSIYLILLKINDNKAKRKRLWLLLNLINLFQYIIKYFFILNV